MTRMASWGSMKQSGIAAGSWRSFGTFDLRRDHRQRVGRHREIARGQPVGSKPNSRERLVAAWRAGAGAAGGGSIVAEAARATGVGAGFGAAVWLRRVGSKPNSRSVARRARGPAAGGAGPGPLPARRPARGRARGGATLPRAGAPPAPGR